jgi:hypothetical protein
MTGQGMRSRLVVLASLLQMVALVGTSSSCSVYALQEVGAGDYISWSTDYAERVIKAMRRDGRVGGVFDTRMLSTDRSYNYKLTATWLTPEVIRAVARIAQVNGFLSDEATQDLVEDAEAAGETVVLVEIDPREGSGVIPLDWVAALRWKDREDGSSKTVRGVSTPALRRVPALAGLLTRNYDYDRFWVVFPLHSPEGQSLFDETTLRVALVVRIYDKEGRVDWAVPNSVIEQHRNPTTLNP